MTIIVDAHEDIAYNALTFGRDYRKSALVTRRLEAGTPAAQNGGGATLGMPDALLGRVGIVFATLFVAPEHSKMGQWDTQVYSSPDEAFRLAWQQVDYYDRLADESERVRLVKTQADLQRVLDSWTEGKMTADHRQGLILLMEGADPIVEPKQFEEWYGRGVRIVGLAWKQTRYAGGTGMPGPLTTMGRELLDTLASFNAMLDLSHLAEEAFFEALERYEGSAIIASHSNPRRFCDSDRHLSDTMIRQLAERDGVMGIVMYNRFLSMDWSKGDPKHEVPLSVVIDVIDHVCQITGSAAHVGIGTDFDGGFGAESIPDGLDTVGDLWNLDAALRSRGFSENDLGAILGGNMLRKLRQSLPA